MQALRDAKRAWDAGEDTRFWGRLGENLSDTGRWNYRRIKGTHEIVTRENMESYIPTLSSEDAERTLERIHITQQDVAARTTTWGNYFNGLDDGKKRYIPKLIEETKDLANLTGNDLVQANRNAQKAVLDHNQAVQKQSLSARLLRIMNRPNTRVSKVGFQSSIARYLHGSKAVPVFYAVRISNRSDSPISCSRNRLIFTIHGSDQPFPNVLLGNC